MKWWKRLLHGRRDGLIFVVGAAFAMTVAAPLYGIITAPFMDNGDTFQMTQGLYDSLSSYVNFGMHGPYPPSGSFVERRLTYAYANGPYADDLDFLEGHCLNNAMGKANFEQVDRPGASFRLFNIIKGDAKSKLLNKYDSVGERPLWNLSPSSLGGLDECIRHSILASLCTSHVQQMVDEALIAARSDLLAYRRQAKREMEENYCASLRGPVPGHSEPDGH